MFLFPFTAEKSRFFVVEFILTNAEGLLGTTAMLPHQTNVSIFLKN